MGGLQSKGPKATKAHNMPRLKISSKVLLYFLLVSLLPLVVANFILVSSANTQLLKAAGSKQQAVATDLTERVSNYLNERANSLRYQALLYAGGQSQTTTEQNLAALFHQDKDLRRLSVLDSQGNSQVVYDFNGLVPTRLNESGTDGFKSVYFLNGKTYISSVTYSVNNVPNITIAVPVFSSDFTKHLNNLSQANFGSYTKPEDIKGVLVAHYDTSDLWQSVLSTKIGDGGYAYVVDGLGNLIAHPDAQFLAQHQKLADVQAVRSFINGDLATKKTSSETGQNVISTARTIPNSGWAVVVEEPVSSIYASNNAYIKLAATIGVVAIVLSVLMSIFFRKQLVVPIQKLTRGAKRLGKGHFDQKIDLKSKDELQDLADTFNKMADDINSLINDLKANNEGLSIEQTKLNNIISSVSDGIIALDKRARLVSINPPAAKLVGRSEQDLIGERLSDIFLWEHNGVRFMPDLSKPGLTHYADLVLAFGGKVTYLDLNVSVTDSPQSDVAAIITVHDQTQSRELDFMKLDFVAIAAHELRTPLTVVNGYLDMLNQSVKKKLSIQDIENLQKAIVGSNQLRDLINKLLNIARIERGEMDLIAEKLDLHRLVQDNVNEHKTAANQREQIIAFQTDIEGPAYVPADPASIVEVLNNLQGNAIKFTGKGGKIMVTLTKANGQYRVEVADNGPGIPENLRKNLFSKFYRAERSLISGTRGTGLGLFISKTIIELQHGTIGIEPDSGKGSTFFFSLPVYDPAKHDTLVSKEKGNGKIRGWFKKRPHS